MLEWLKKHAADVFKIGVSYVVGSAALVFCLYTAGTHGKTDHYIQVLICILGGVLGWMAGLALTPSSANEKKAFTEYGKAIATFGSGFGLAKLEALAHWFKDNHYLYADTNTAWTQALLFVCCFFILGLFTYISRLHVGEADERQIKREKAYVELAEAIEKLQTLR